MSKTIMIRARTEPSLKEEVDKIFKKLGLTTTEAINLFYRQIALQHGLPFEVKIPNHITKETFEKTDKGEELKAFDTIDDLFEDLDN